MGNCWNRNTNINTQFDFQLLELPALPYGLHDLEPILNAEVLSIHYGQHHKKYVDEYNKWSQLLEEAKLEGNQKKIQRCIDKVSFNFGGHYAHSLYWANLAPMKNSGGVIPSDKSPLVNAICETWGTVEAFIEEFKTKCMAIQGSGWCWLALSADSQKLSICHTEQHDCVEKKGKIPLLVVDVWEHAYYLQYKNMKADYFANIWKVINWSEVEKRYSKALK